MLSGTHARTRPTSSTAKKKETGKIDQRQRVRAEPKSSFKTVLVSSLKELTFDVRGMESVGNWHRHAVSCFFNYGEHLFQFSEILEHGYASLGYGEYCSVFSNGSFLNQVLLNQKVQVFFQDFAVNVRLIHYVRQF